MAADVGSRRTFVERVTGNLTARPVSAPRAMRVGPGWRRRRMANRTGPRALATVALAALLAAGCGPTSGPESAACEAPRVDYDRLTELVGDGLGRVEELTGQVMAFGPASREGMAAYAELETILPVFEQFVFDTETLVDEHRGCFTDQERDEVVRVAQTVRRESGR